VRVSRARIGWRYRLETGPSTSDRWGDHRPAGRPAGPIMRAAHDGGRRSRRRAGRSAAALASVPAT